MLLNAAECCGRLHNTANKNDFKRCCPLIVATSVQPDRGHAGVARVPARDRTGDNTGPIREPA
eukprot:14574604-Alexandrium_andersonii.AAC.1